VLRSAHANFYKTHCCAELGQKESNPPSEFEWAANMNFKNNSTIFSVNACKSFGIPTAIEQYGATLHTGGIKEIMGRDIHFNDGTVFKDASDIIFATGYRTECAAMKDPELKDAFHCPRSLWKNMCAPGEEDIFLLGFCRPQQINLITCCEMQARALALIVSEKKAKPPIEQQKKEIMMFKEHMSSSFERGCSALVDFTVFTDGLAEFIGCQINLTKIMLTDPKLWWYLVYSAICPLKFRLVGPGAKPELARQKICETPLYHYGNRMKRDIVLTLKSVFEHVKGLVLMNPKRQMTGPLASNVTDILLTGGLLGAAYVGSKMMLA